MMNRFSYYILGILSLIISPSIFASQITESEIRNWNKTPEGSILKPNGVEVINLFTMVQSFLLKVLLPVVVIGASLYIAYQLFSAEGDETKMKKAWRSVTYTAIALIAIALSYAFVSIISRISI